MAFSDIHKVFHVIFEMPGPWKPTFKTNPPVFFTAYDHLDFHFGFDPKNHHTYLKRIVFMDLKYSVVVDLEKSRPKTR